MKKANFLTSACRCCRNYTPEGRRGGTCELLGAPVKAGWKACVYACPPFAGTWDSLEEIVHLENSLSLDYGPIEPAASVEAREEKEVATA